MSNLIKKPTEFAQHIVAQYVQAGDHVIDATLGGGYDTVFLSALVGDSGKVYAFDIQAQAIEIAKKRIVETCGGLEKVMLIRDGHENMARHVSEPVSAIMFNLGYLPNGDHAITTRSETTLLALEAGLNLLKSNGIISIVLYPGHPEGADEKRIVLEYLAELNPKQYHVCKMELINQSAKRPPLVALITRK